MKRFVRSRMVESKPSSINQPGKTPRAEIHAETPTISFVSLGCSKNLVDSERMLGLLAQGRYAIVPESRAR